MEDKITLEVGKTYAVVYPFVREKVELLGFDGPYSEISWRPGCRYESGDEYGDGSYSADADGEMMLIVVSLHKPGRYPGRVFYIRQWKDPDGGIFGKRNLRMTTMDSFRRLIKGYRHRYELNGE